MKKRVMMKTTVLLLVFSMLVSICCVGVSATETATAAATDQFALDVTATANASDSSIIDVVITVKGIKQQLDAVEFDLHFDDGFVKGVITDNTAAEDGSRPMDVFMTVKPMYTLSVSGVEVPVSRYEQICYYNAINSMYECRFADLMEYTSPKPGQTFNGLINDGDLVITIQFKLLEGFTSSDEIVFSVDDVKGTTRDGLNSVTGTGASVVYAASGHVHQWADATCTSPKTCIKCGVSEGSPVAHSWSGYSCTTCGKTRDFYLFGYINGADYACEADYANMGQYKFVNGKLTTTFTQDSYIGVKTTDNGAWYMVQSYANSNSAVFHKTTTGASEKMFVPGGVKVTFTLNINHDDTLSVSYESAPAVVIPKLTLTYPTLSFEAEILYNVYFTADDISSVTEMGLITFDSKLTNGTIADAVDIIPGYITSGTSYVVHSNGVPAKNLADALYFKVYAKLSDGSYTYSSVAGYNAVAYAKSVLGSADTSMSAKRLMVAMLNYGAAAQTHFGYKTDNLMNAFLKEPARALVADYNESMVDDVVAASSAKAGHFVMQSGSFTSIYPTVSFDGAFSINYYFGAGLTPDNGLTFAYWDSDTYNSADRLTTSNASGLISMTKDGDLWTAAVEGIAAKEIDKTVYVAVIYRSGGTLYTSKVIAYSIGKYCETSAANGNAFGAATAVYGYYAKTYFANL